ncbi:MAG TPA: FAD-dependent oxidoreductase [Acetobacteraceae bacterium]|nr:FAD-dependent oxidoreductase [Acetobacteraceae bacterium]
MSVAFQQHARIVIIGGGAIGCSLAYHLARRGEKDVLLLEKSQLTNGCTWHAAGLVGQLRGKKSLTQLMQNSVAVYDRLEAESGQAIDWKKVGSLRLASSPARWSEIQRSIALARSFGFECHALSAMEARDLFPFIDPEGVVGAAFIPSDGYIDPYSMTHAYASAARKNGAVLKEGVLVTDIVTDGRRITGVVTDHGNIGCDILVNCAGLWAKRIADMVGVPLAAGVVEHQYFLTEKKLDLPKSLPTLRDPDKNFYLKPDVGSFAIGGWEDGTKGCWRSRPPFEFGRELFPENMERLELFALPCAKRLPVLNEIGIQTIINGPIPVSADGEPIMGPTPEYDNFFVACGFTAGIAASGGAGEAMANWILEGDPGLDLWNFDVRRFGKPHAVGRYLEERAINAYGSYYKIHWPAEESQAARGVRQSPLYAPLRQKGAVFGSRFTWERPLWFAPPGGPTTDEPSFEGKPNWFPFVGEEHRAIRESVAIIDQSSSGKIEIEGSGAMAFLQRLTANDVAGKPGRSIRALMLNAQGGIEIDATLLHVAADHFLLIVGTGFTVRYLDWLQRQLTQADAVRLRDVTSGTATLSLYGPRSRALLQSVSDNDLSNVAFPYRSVQDVELGFAPARAVRTGSTGELGYDLHMPTEYAGYLYDLLCEAGAPHGLRDVGSRALETCRLEKGYLAWSSDISPYINPLEAGLAAAITFDKGDFIGRAALLWLQAAGAEQQLCTLILPGFAPLHGGEPIIRDGEVVGRVASTGFGYTIGRTIAYGFLPTRLAGESAFEIHAFGQSYAAERRERCLYDPADSRLLG